jgi:hypothetical protein
VPLPLPLVPAALMLTWSSAETAPASKSSSRYCQK